MLEDAEKNLDGYKKAIELKDKQLPDIKKILQGAKKSYNAIVNENTELHWYTKVPTVPKTTTTTIIFWQKKNTLGKNNQKNIKKFLTKKRVTVNLK